MPLVTQERPKPLEKPKRARRRRKPRASVRVAEIVSRVLITAGGAGTILAVAGIFVFLVWVVVPLFLPASIARDSVLRAAAPGADVDLVHVFVDEHQLAAALLTTDGAVRVLRLDDGSVLEERQLFDRTPTAHSFVLRSADAAFGFENGDVVLGEMGFMTDFLELPQVTSELAAMEPGDVRTLGSGVVVMTSERQHRRTRFVRVLGDPVPLASGKAVRALDLAITTTGPAFVALDAAGGLALARVRKTRNLLTNKETVRLSETPLPYEARPELGAPAHVLLNGGADNVVVAWDDGRLDRYDTRAEVEPSRVESIDLVEQEGERLTALTYLLGSTTLLAGDTTGRVRAWFRIKPQNVRSADGSLLVAAHEMEGADAPVSSIAPSPRTRLAAVGYADGDVRVVQVTTEETIVEADAVLDGVVHDEPGHDEPVRRIAITPKEDGIVALAGGALLRWQLDPMHPAATFRSLFSKVWYEGYEEPEHVWLSSSGTDEFEKKLGLVPLVFGTLKATVYSLLFGVPLALLAAIYTSEFLSPRLRNPLKSSIEMMASLPSVVLGFLAAVIIAPYVQHVVPAVLVSFVTLPIAILTGAYLWQLVPRDVALRLDGWPRAACMIATLPAGVGAAFLLGPAVENALFAGDLMLWLDGQVGEATGGWMVLTFPLAVLTVLVVSSRVLGPWLRSASLHWSHARCAAVDVAKAAALLAMSLLCAWISAEALSAAGFDPRGTYLDTYVQRNALIVGFVMGFAVIPIIYTIAEDALSSVPSHLRLASLGAGATPWQTAVRIILPTAMSGLFSAVMIGLGRAVGETMVVLMATGNTPLMEWNMFNGFRTLSANIAVELPEAARNSTHYRTLFLAGLTLFAMTFVVNTLAEAIRLRFRKRAFEL